MSENIFIESPLHYFRGRSAGSDLPGLIIREAPPSAHLLIRGDSESEAFRDGICEVLGLALPTATCSCSRENESGLFWLSPNEWLAVVPGGNEAEIESRLRNALQGHFSIVDVSGGQTLVNLSGSAVDLVLMKSSGYDFHPRNFGPGQCVQTTFAKTTALVGKREDGSFDLVIRRSFADYLALWLLDAGTEYGCRIE